MLNQKKEMNRYVNFTQYDAENTLLKDAENTLLKNDYDLDHLDQQQRINVCALHRFIEIGVISVERAKSIEMTDKIVAILDLYTKYCNTQHCNTPGFRKESSIANLSEWIDLLTLEQSKASSNRNDVNFKALGKPILNRATNEFKRQIL